MPSLLIISIMTKEENSNESITTSTMNSKTKAKTFQLINYLKLLLTID
jgi:hypothetical protein